MAGRAAQGRSLVRAVLAACPGLGPVLAARDSTARPPRFAALRARLREARPHARRPRAAPGSWHDAALADPEAVLLAPLALAGRAHAVLAAATPGSRRGALFLEARRRGLELRARVAAPPWATPAAGSGAWSSSRRTSRRDLGRPRRRGGPAPRGRGAARLRRARLEPGASEVDGPGPLRPGPALVVDVDPQLDGVAQRRAAVRQGASRRAGPPPDRAAPARDALRPRGRARSARRRARGRGTGASSPGPGDPAAREARGGAASGPPPLPDQPRPLPARRPQRPREPPPDVPRGARRGPVAPRPRRARLARRSSATTRGGPGPTTCARRPRWRRSSARRREQSQVDVHVTRRKHVRPARGGARARLRRPLRDAARRPARPRGPAARRRSG